MKKILALDHFQHLPAGRHKFIVELLESKSDFIVASRRKERCCHPVFASNHEVIYEPNQSACFYPVSSFGFQLLLYHSRFG
ncbi:MAG: hypothetical protein PHF31_09695 [Methylobacter sp.]|nr:hypothetical protein [Methylobacter sp.]